MTVTINGTTGIDTVQSGAVTRSKLPAGTVLQVVNFVLSAQTSTTSGTYVDTGLTCNITPTFSTSKVLVLVNQTMFGLSGGSVEATTQLQRNGTALLTEAYSNYSVSQFYRSNFNYLDSPNTTSTITYKVQMKKNSGGSPTLYYCFGDGGGQTNCEITLMEIAA